MISCYTKWHMLNMIEICSTDFSFLYLSDFLIESFNVICRGQDSVSGWLVTFWQIDAILPLLPSATANLPPLTFILASWRCFTISCSWHLVLTPTDNPNDGNNYNCLLIKQWFISKWLQRRIKLWFNNMCSLSWFSSVRSNQQPDGKEIR